MGDKFTLFFPWKTFISGSKHYAGIKRSHVYREKQFFLLKSENIKWRNKPYFAILNENDTVKNFIDAILLDKLEDARVYISKAYATDLDLNEIGRLFEKSYKYSLNYYFKDKLGRGLNRVTIAAKTNDGKKYNDIIHVQLLEEPDMYSKWKIYKIEKE